MVAHDLGATLVTLGHVTTEYSRAAGLNITHDAELATRQTLLLPVGFAMRAEDGRNLERGAGPVFDFGVRTHGLGLVIEVVVQAVKW